MRNVPQKRYEMKYLIGKGYGEVLKGRFNTILEPDPLALEDGKYHIRSIYFDDSENNSYFEKMAGIETRQKIRIRHYNFDRSFVVLEKKVKQDDFILKKALRIDPEIMNNMLSGNNGDLLNMDNPLAKKLYGEIKSDFVYPSVGIGYDRTAFLFPNTDVRITIDENIYYFNPKDDSFDKNIPVVRENENSVVLEVKYGRFLPSVINDILCDVPMHKESYSKYIICKDLKGLD